MDNIFQYEKSVKDLMKDLSRFSSKIYFNKSTETYGIDISSQEREYIYILFLKIISSPEDKFVNLVIHSVKNGINKSEDIETKVRDTHQFHLVNEDVVFCLIHLFSIDPLERIIPVVMKSLDDFFNSDIDFIVREQTLDTLDELNKKFSDYDDKYHLVHNGFAEVITKSFMLYFMFLNAEKHFIKNVNNGVVADCFNVISATLTDNSKPEKVYVQLNSLLNEAVSDFMRINSSYY